MLYTGSYTWEETRDRAIISLRFDHYIPRGGLRLEHALFGCSGNWGLLTSDAEMALVGAESARFIEVLTSALPDSQAQMSSDFAEYLEDFSGEYGRNDAREMLAHLFGDR